MVLHDAQMTKFSQWWQRKVRSRYSYAQRTWLHSASLEIYYVRTNLSIWFWGYVLPLLCLSLFVPTSGISLLFLAGYSILIYRIYRHMKKRGFTTADSLLHTQFCILRKLPQVQGQIQFYIDKLFSFVT